MATQEDSGQAGREGRPQRRLPIRTYFILALVAVTVISLIWARVAGSRARALNAENNTKIERATGYLAKTATADAERARSAILRQNLGSAQDALRRAEETIDALDEVTARKNHDAVAKGREALERAGDALRKGNDEAAQKAIDDMTRALGPLVLE